MEATTNKYEPESASETATEDDSPGFLELLADMEVGNQSLSQTISATTVILQDITAIYAEATTSVREADARGDGAAIRLAIANRTASKLGETASRFEVASGDYENTVERIEPGLVYLLTRLAEDPTQLAAAPNLPAQIKGFAEAVRASMESALDMRATTLEIGKASRSMRQVSHRLANSLKKFADISGRVSRWSDLADKIPEAFDAATITNSQVAH